MYGECQDCGKHFLKCQCDSAQQTEDYQEIKQILKDNPLVIKSISDNTDRKFDKAVMKKLKK